MAGISCLLFSPQFSLSSPLALEVVEEEADGGNEAVVVEEILVYRLLFWYFQQHGVFHLAFPFEAAYIPKDRHVVGGHDMCCILLGYV